MILFNCFTSEVNILLYITVVNLNVHERNVVCYCKMSHYQEKGLLSTLQVTVISTFLF